MSQSTFEKNGGYFVDGVAYMDCKITGDPVPNVSTDSVSVIGSRALMGKMGKLFPDVGVIALDGDLLSQSNRVPFNGTASNWSTTSANNQFFKAIASGSSFKLRSEETVSSNYVFIRARNSEFNSVFFEENTNY